MTSVDAPNSANKHPSQRWFVRLVLLVVVLAGAYSMSPNIADPDLWGHVQYGRDLINDRAVPATTTYSFTANGFRWINHENLSEVVMALIVDRLGPTALLFGKFLLSLGVITLILRANLKTGNGWIATSIIVLLMSSNLSYHWAIRPQLASFVCFTLMIALLQFCFAGWRDHWQLTLPSRWNRRDWTRDNDPLQYDSARMRMLWLAVPLFCLWANSHGGFVAGFLIFTTYLMCRALEAICQRGRCGWGLVRRMALMAVVAGLATFVNPYGPQLHLWLMESLGTSRPEIQDWSNQQLFGLVGFKLWALIALAGFSRLLSRKPFDFTQNLLLVLTLWQALTHFRHVPFFAILVGFWIGPHLQSALQRFSARRPAKQSSPGVTWAMNGVLAGIACLISIQLGNRLIEIRVEKDKFPVDAIAFMHHHNLNGRLVVTYDWAQYSIAALAIDAQSESAVTTVAFDGRFRTCYPQQIVDMHFDFLFGEGPNVRRSRSELSPPCDPGRVLRHGSPDLVLIRKQGELTTRHIRGYRSEWVRLYQDSIAEIWGRRSRYDDPNSKDFFPPRHRFFDPDKLVDPPLQGGSVRWPAIPGA